MQRVRHNIADYEHGAYVVAETEEIISLGSADFIMYCQICRCLCAHGVAAEKAGDNRIAAFFGNSKQPFQYRGCPEGDIVHGIQPDNQVGQDDKGE